MKGRIVLREGDLTEQEVDALVNAANSRLELAEGVARAIREKGGEEIAAECRELAPVPVGEAVVTGAGRLSARWVIHAVTMDPGGQTTAGAVRSAMQRCLALATERSCRRMAIPALGAGAAGLGLQRCAEILLEEARAHLAGATSLEEIRFVLFGEPAYRVFESVQDAQRILGRS